ncbi:MAG TPA: iron-sulfur cluster assembly scaffold protein [Gammaproteobacteria bacterium]
MDYSLEVQERFRSSEGAGEFAEGAPGVVTGEAEDRTLNVWFRFQIEFAGSAIRTVKYRVFGCPHSIAAAAWVADALPGSEVEALDELDTHGLLRRLDAPIEKLGKLLVLEDALRRCRKQIANFDRARNGI